MARAVLKNYYIFLQYVLQFYLSLLVFLFCFSCFCFGVSSFLLFLLLYLLICFLLLMFFSTLKHLNALPALPLFCCFAALLLSCFHFMFSALYFRCHLWCHPALLKLRSFKVSFQEIQTLVLFCKCLQLFYLNSPYKSRWNL